jgi:hypothetical protein
MKPRWKLPPPRELGWRLRRVEDAETRDERLADGRRELRIRHPVIRGVSCQALAWWFQSFDRPCEFQGVRYDQMYLLWHPIDHHSVTITRDGAGRVSPGQTIHIREAFGRDMRFAVDQRVTIHRWDDSGIGFHIARAGRRAFSLDHEFRDVAGGAQYDSRMVLGHDGGLIRPIANYIAMPLRFGRAHADAWLKHNVEEVGCFEHFLPELYASRADG